MFSFFMMIWTALPVGQSGNVWQLNQPAAVLTVAEGLESPWNAQRIGRLPRSSVMPSSKP